jgi:hypothetical protein
MIARTLLLAASLIWAASAFAESPQDHEAHHPAGTAGAQAQPAEPSAPSGGATAPGTTGQGMMRGMMGGSMMGPDQSIPGGMMGMMNMMMRGRMGPEHIEGRLAYLKAELKITDVQAPQWNAYAEATRSNASAMSQMRNAMMSQSASSTLPERLALEAKAVTAHLTALKTIEGVVAQLYSVLNDDQKKIADQIIVGPMGMPIGMM